MRVLVGDFAKSARYRPASSTHEWKRNIPFHVDIIVGDIMIIAPQIGSRPNMVLNTADATVRLALGESAINDGEIAFEGHWSTSRISLGFVANVDNGEISLHMEKSGRFATSFTPRSL